MLSINLLPFDGELFYFPNFLTPQYALYYFDILKEKVKWEQPIIKIFGKSYLSPRLTAWYGDNQAVYQYSGVKNIPQSWFFELLELKSLVEKFTYHEFNSVLLNWYRNHHDSMGWHADDEKELGINPIIASVSLGITRKFVIRNKRNKKLRFVVPLENGSLLLMKGCTQHYWEHTIPKQTQLCLDRINLTFRKIIL